MPERKKIILTTYIRQCTYFHFHFTFSKATQWFFSWSIQSRNARFNLLYQVSVFICSKQTNYRKLSSRKSRRFFLSLGNKESNAYYSWFLLKATTDYWHDLEQFKYQRHPSFSPANNYTSMFLPEKDWKVFHKEIHLLIVNCGVSGPKNIFLLFIELTSKSRKNYVELRETRIEQLTPNRGVNYCWHQ